MDNSTVLTPSSSTSQITCLDAHDVWWKDVTIDFPELKDITFTFEKENMVQAFLAKYKLLENVTDK